MTDEQVREIAAAIRNIAHGGIAGPEGIEGLTMVIGGDPKNGTTLAGAIYAVAEAIGRIADIMEESK